MPGRILHSLIGHPPAAPPSPSPTATEPPTSISMGIKHALKERRASMDILHRDHRKPSQSKRSSTTSPHRPPPVSLETVIESPPLVFYGTIEHSSGALLSGQLQFTINQPEMLINTLLLTLNCIVTTKKPVEKGCPSCATQINELVKWEVHKEPVTLKKGTHSYPFSYLLPGHLPATTHGALATVDYELAATVVTGREEFKHQKSLTLQRAVMPGSDKLSVRIFPPTNLTAHVTVCPIIHPIGEIPIALKITGCVKKGKETQTQWRLRKLNWRIDEHSKMVSHVCPKHAHKIGGPSKGVLHQDTRIIGSGDFKHGWKSDFASDEGSIWFEFPGSIKADKHPVCDVDTQSGLEVTHKLVIELVVAEEYCPLRNIKLITPTGAARILRMSFNVIVTERSGMGISWDEEQPPMYEDVPASPPTYTQIEDYNGSLEDEDIDRLRLSE
ncbi:MAG: hypothetical protein M1817_005717 [Caeruleum heppii]|nr:MAG: hypothetical protein M1817_005717 [Caeruleum heppii]